MSYRRAKRGVTLIELLVVIAIQVAVLAAVTTLLCYTLRQVGQGTAGITSLNQATKVFQSVSATIRESYQDDIITSNGVSGLRCTMPLKATDKDGDGVNDVFGPSSFGSSGSPDYGSNGQRIWYYFSDATGSFGTNGTILWRAVRTDDSNPTSTDVDKTWSYYYNSTPRFPLVTGLTYAVSASRKSTTLTVSASAALRATEQASGDVSAPDAQAVALKQEVPWRTRFE